jgi:ubiquinone biosynthesis accessory factor UbiK
VRGSARAARPWCGALRYVPPMIDPRLFEELRQKIDEALRASPAQDIEKNLRALLAAWFDRLDLVLREDFEVQKKLLERAQAKLAELEARIAELEARK